MISSLSRLRIDYLTIRRTKRGTICTQFDLTLRELPDSKLDSLVLNTDLWQVEAQGPFR